MILVVLGRLMSESIGLLLRQHYRYYAGLWSGPIEIEILILAIEGHGDDRLYSRKGEVTGNWKKDVELLAKPRSMTSRVPPVRRSQLRLLQRI